MCVRGEGFAVWRGGIVGTAGGRVLCPFVFAVAGVRRGLDRRVFVGIDCLLAPPLKAALSRMNRERETEGERLRIGRFQVNRGRVRRVKFKLRTRANPNPSSK